MPKPLGPCIILVHLHLYEKGLHLNFFYLYFILTFALEVYLIPLA